MTELPLGTYLFHHSPEHIFDVATVWRVVGLASKPEWFDHEYHDIVLELVWIPVVGDGYMEIGDHYATIKRNLVEYRGWEVIEETDIPLKMLGAV